MKNQIKLILFILLFAFSGCKKEKEVPLKILSPEALEWMYFEKGTWWQYKNQNYGIIKKDSVTWSDIDTVDIHSRGSSGYRLSFRAMRAKMKVFDSYKNEYLDWSASSGSESVSSNAKDPIYYLIHSSNGKNYIEVFYLPILEEYELNVGFAKIIMEEVIDTMEVAGKIYNNVVKIRITKNPMSGGYETVQYFVKNVGIIRTEVKVLKDTYGYDYEWQVWDLIDYHVVQ